MGFFSADWTLWELAFVYNGGSKIVVMDFDFSSAQSAFVFCIQNLVVNIGFPKDFIDLLM
jgi:hypothetical protein